MNNLLKKAIKKYQRTQDLISKIQKPCIEIRVNSKKAIALLRRDNIKGSEDLIKRAEGVFKIINKTMKGNKDLLRLGFYREAVEEYIEAITFFDFLNERKIPDFILAGPEEIISGICDFSGELVRKAITIGSIKDLEKILSYKKVIENIIERLTEIGLTGKLRQKYDEAERNLRRIEDILYDIKLKTI